MMNSTRKFHHGKSTAILPPYYQFVSIVSPQICKKNTFSFIFKQDASHLSGMNLNDRHVCRLGCDVGKFTLFARRDAIDSKERKGQRPDKQKKCASEGQSFMCQRKQINILFQLHKKIQTNAWLESISQTAKWNLCQTS